MAECPNCATEVDEHEAGRCLDAWVASAVFNEPEPKSRFDRPSEDGAWRWTGDYVPRFAPKPFSTDIAAAWEVVGRVSNGYYIDIGVDEHGAQVQINKYEDGSWDILPESIRADTAPLAICRAAIKAVRQR